VAYYSHWSYNEIMNMEHSERRKWCEEFSKTASQLGVHVGLGLGTSVELDKWYSLGCYYKFIGDVSEALSCFDKYLDIDPHNEGVITMRKSCAAMMGEAQQS